jgi:iron-sulfur cluster repair protein YtfE (RIC family)
VSACCEDDHRAIDALLKDVEPFVAEQALAAAAQYFALFRRSLENHIEAEETVLFPFYELGTGCNGPTTVMKREHAEMRSMMDFISGLLSGEEHQADVTSSLRELERLLASHNAKEERILYPAIDSVATTGGELAELVTRVQPFLERRR